ncbi:MAG: hypothetical protein PUC00_06825 [Clostridiales bacterium]|nr:hypothetical protein [Clostridiales bacterium]
MSNILFSHRKASLVGYLGPAGSSGRRVTEFMTFPLHANAPDIDTLPTLFTVNGMCFHAIHGSVSALNAKPSISVSKEAHFPGRKRKVYVEFYLDVSDSLRVDSIGREYTCILAMLDPAGNTVYATSPDVALGEPLAGQPVLDDVYHVSQKSAFGFSYALMVMRSTYWQYVLAWMRDLIVVLVLTAAIVAGTVTLLYRLIYKPIRLFAEEVETICDGDLTPSSQSFGMREFDELFTKIEEMKRAITLSLAGVYPADGCHHPDRPRESGPAQAVQSDEQQIAQRGQGVHRHGTHDVRVSLPAALFRDWRTTGRGQGLTNQQTSTKGLIPCSRRWKAASSTALTTSR